MGNIIVSGFQECGASKLTGMLNAGGLHLAGGAKEPSYELAEATPAPGAILSDMFAAWPPLMRYQANQFIVPQLSGPGYGGTRRIDPAWWATLGGMVVKVVYPHLIIIPRGTCRAIWCDPTDERRRAIAVLTYGYSGTDAPPRSCIDLINHYFVERRAVARGALERAGATILDINQAEITGSEERCRAVCERIAAFLDVPLDVDAMVERARFVPTGRVGDGILLDGPEARTRARSAIDTQPPGTRVIFVQPRQAG